MDEFKHCELEKARSNDADKSREEKEGTTPKAATEHTEGTETIEARTGLRRAQR